LGESISTQSGFHRVTLDGEGLDLTADAGSARFDGIHGSANGEINLIDDGSIIDGNGSALNIEGGTLDISAGHIIGSVPSASGIDALEINRRGGRDRTTFGSTT
jgi:hypothetical protein